MRDIESQLADYWTELVADHPLPTAAELMRSRARSGGTAVTAGWDAGKPYGDDLAVDHVLQFHEMAAPDEPRRWRGVGAIAASTVLVAVGLIVAIRVADEDPASSPTATVPVSSPTVTAPVPTPVVADPLPYQWSRVFADVAVFGDGGHREMNSVAVGGPGLVAVGNEYPSFDKEDPTSVVWTSIDGLSWSRVGDDDSVFGGSSISAVIARGSGLVAVGSGDDGAVVWTSVDGLTWMKVPHDEAVFGSAWMRSVTVGGPGLVAVGGGKSATEDGEAAVWTSVDGLAWLRVPHDEAIFGGEATQLMLDVTRGGPGLVAVGYDGRGDWDNSEGQVAAVWTSVDGLTWSRVPHDEIAFGGDNPAMLGVTAGGPGLVAVGYSFPHSAPAAVWTSVDGLTWSRVAHDNGGQMSGTMWSVTVAGRDMVAVGAGGIGAAVWTSPDGVTWSPAPRGDAELDGPWADSRMLEVASAGSRLLAVGSLDRYDEAKPAVWAIRTG